MSKRKSKELTRRDFMRVTVGAAVAAGIGCVDDKSGTAAGAGGNTGDGISIGSEAASTAGEGGVSTAQGGAGGKVIGAAGSMPSGSDKAGVGAGGKVVTGGTTATGGAGAGGSKVTGGAGAGGSTAGSGGTGGGNNPLVAMVRRGDSDWATAVEDAIRLVGGLPNPEKITGKTVMLRPNVISSNPNPETTNPEVIRGVIRAVKAYNPTKIIVADNGFATSSTASSMEDLGITDVCTAEGAQALDLKGRPTVARTLSGVTTQWSGSVNFYKDVFDADYVINIPVCKTHGSANFSMAIKGWFGCVPDRSHTPGNLHKRLAELHLIKQEDFVVLDASKAMVTGGPQNGKAAESKIVVATKDPIAADVTGLCIIKQFGPALGGSGPAYNVGVWAQPQIIRAMELNYAGCLTAKQTFEYAQEGVTEHATIMAFRNA